ncbi:MAG: DMT family transporter [Bacteriovorax sp.]|nr:DMT family transporter [Bacteriovorax sp.]
MILNIILLSFSSAIWGFGFIATRWTFQVFDPFWSNALRFSLAALLSIPFLLYKKSFWRKKNILKKAMLSSVFLLGTLLFQTLGLTSTTVAKSGFITTLYSLFIPLTMMAFTGKKYRGTFWGLIFMALVGMALMCNLEVKDLNKGDFLTLLCAISAAFHIMYIGIVASEIPSAIEFNFLQNIFVAIFSVIIALIFKGPVDLTPLADYHSDAVKGLLFLGVISSLISFTIQVVAQKKIPAHIAGLIFLMESPFAALFGYLVLKELLNPLNLLGAFLIIMSVLLVPVFGREVTTLKRAPEEL